MSKVAIGWLVVVWQPSVFCCVNACMLSANQKFCKKTKHFQQEKLNKDLEYLNSSKDDERYTSKVSTASFAWGSCISNSFQANDSAFLNRIFLSRAWALWFLVYLSQIKHHRTSMKLIRYKIINPNQNCRNVSSCVYTLYLLDYTVSTQSQKKLLIFVHDLKWEILCWP